MKKILLFCIFSLNLIFGADVLTPPNQDADKEQCKLSNTPFGALIRKYESANNYNIYNRTKPKLQAFPNGNITNLSISEIMAKQASREMFAVGAYQIITDTMKAVVAKLSLNSSAKFDKETQDKAFDDYLTKNKRPSIYAYFFQNGSIDSAAKNVAYEWASMPIKQGGKLNRGGTSNGCSSYYSGDGLNSAHLCYDKLIQTMEESKKQLESGTCEIKDEPEEEDKKQEPNQAGGGYAGGKDYVHSKDEALGGTIFNLPSIGVGGACRCTPQINSSYTKYLQEILISLKEQQQALLKLQDSQIKQSDILDEQNIILTNENELLKDNLLKRDNLIFELRKKIELK